MKTGILANSATSRWEMYVPSPQRALLGHRGQVGSLAPFFRQATGFLCACWQAKEFNHDASHFLGAAFLAQLVSAFSGRPQDSTAARTPGGSVRADHHHADDVRG